MTELPLRNLLLQLPFNIYIYIYGEMGLLYSTIYAASLTITNPLRYP
jgi:hypothetical protein